MATKKPRLSVMFTEEALAQIQAYQAREHISTMSRAVSRLTNLALSALELEEDEKAASLKAEAAQLLDDYIGLDSHGRHMVRMVAGEEKDRMKRG